MTHEFTPDALADILGFNLPHAEAVGEPEGEFFLMDLRLGAGSVRALSLGDFKALDDRVKRYGGRLQEQPHGTYEARIKVPILELLSREDRTLFHALVQGIEGKIGPEARFNSDGQTYFELNSIGEDVEVPENVLGLLIEKYAARGFELSENPTFGWSVIMIKRRR